MAPVIIYRQVRAWVAEKITKEVLLDKVPDVTPLRAIGFKMLLGKTVLAVVYDSDVSINYGPLNGNLMGTNLGLVALQIVKVTQRFDGSSGSLPQVTVKIVSVDTANSASLKLCQYPVHLRNHLTLYRPQRLWLLV